MKAPQVVIIVSEGPEEASKKKLYDYIKLMYVETGVGELDIAVDVDPEIVPPKCKYMLGGSFMAMNDVYFTKKGVNEDFIKIHEKE